MTEPQSFNPLNHPPVCVFNAQVPACKPVYSLEVFSVHHKALNTIQDLKHLPGGQQWIPVSKGCPLQCDGV